MLAAHFVYTGSILEPNQDLPYFCHFSITAPKGAIGGLVTLGPGNGE